MSEDDLGARLLSMYSAGQLVRLLEITAAVMERGHGEITIMIKQHRARFIAVRFSEDFVVEKNGGALSGETQGVSGKDTRR